MTSIGNSAFSRCSNLATVIFEEGSQVTSIEKYAFYDCSNLANVYYDGTIEEWMEISFDTDDPDGCNPLCHGANLYVNGDELVTEVSIDTATTINALVFHGCTSITKVTIGSQVTSIGWCAFNRCSSLTSITIPASVTSIGTYAFSGCSNLANVYYEGTIEEWMEISFDYYGNNPLSNGANLYVNGDELVTEISIDTATKINDYVFNGCESLTKLTIGSQVTSIGRYAFYGCTGLVEINYNATNLADLSNNNYVFSHAGEGGTGITVNIGANVRRIPAYLFCPSTSNGSYLPNIVTVNFAENSQCTRIGNCAFRYCNPSSITIPASVTSIGTYAFSGCSNLTTVIFEEGSQLDSIGDSAFFSCSSLVYVVNKSALEFNVGDYGTSTSNNPILEIVSDESEAAFVDIDGNRYKDYNGERYFIKNLDGSSEIEIDSSCTRIYQYAFYNRDDITSVTIPASVTSIGERAFYGCSNLATVIFENPNGWWVQSSNETIELNSTDIENTETLITYLTSTYDDYTWYRTDTKMPFIITSDGMLLKYVGSDTDVVIPSTYSISEDGEVIAGDDYSVTSIGNSAFAYCDSLTSITIPAGVTSIGNSAFYGCSSLTSITIPASVTYIGSSAFFGCSNLATVIFEEGSRLESIGDYAFRSCGILTSITIPASVTSIRNYAFHNCSNLATVIIESNYAYKAATRTSACGYLLDNATEVRVLTSCIGTDTNSYLEDTANFTKTTSEDGLYYIYTKV